MWILICKSTIQCINYLNFLSLNCSNSLFSKPTPKQISTQHIDKKDFYYVLQKKDICVVNEKF